MYFFIPGERRNLIWILLRLSDLAGCEGSLLRYFITFNGLSPQIASQRHLLFKLSHKKFAFLNTQFVSNHMRT